MENATETPSSGADPIVKRRNGAAGLNHNGTAHDGSATVDNLLEQGRTAHHQGKHEAAIDLLDRAISAEAENADVHWQRACALLALGRVDEAAEGFREASRLRPESAPFRNDLGVVLARRGRREEAAAEYREAIRLKADFPDPHNNLGNTLRLDGRLDEAVACYREAMRLRPAYGAPGWYWHTTAPSGLPDRSGSDGIPGRYTRLRFVLVLAHHGAVGLTRPER